MDETRAGEITQLLRASTTGDDDALDRLLPAVYDELREMAARQLASERPEHTLQPTALVHEVFLKLSKQDSLGVADRVTFFGVAGQAMRRILIDHARQRGRQKRGAGERATALDEAVIALEERSGDLVALDEALALLAQRDGTTARLVELRFFVGLTMEEAADILGVSLSSAERSWRTARAFLSSKVQPSE